MLTRLLAPVLAVGLLAVAVDANAGTLTMRDEAQVFSPGDTAQLRSIVGQAPFDARLVTTNNYADQAGFSRFVGTLVSEPNMVVVGIDPQHHHVQVHFGTASHIAEANWPAIERAGNDAFKRSAWEEGGAAIFRAATTAVGQGAVATPGATPSTASSGSFLGVGLFIMLVVGVVLAVTLFAVFRRRSPGYGSVGYGGGAPFQGGGGPYYGPGGGPYYGPGGSRGAMGPLGGGLIGAGLGGIAGYELGKMEGEREQRGFDQGGFDAGGGGSSTPDNGSFDAGGGGSSWDDSGSSGGGGSDFGGGGGDSGGGGGGDSGGGGLDF